MLVFATKKGFALQSLTKNILFLAVCRMIQPTFHLPLLLPKVVAFAGSYHRDLAAYKIKGPFSWKILTSLPTEKIFFIIYTPRYRCEDKEQLWGRGLCELSKANTFDK